MKNRSRAIALAMSAVLLVGCGSTAAETADTATEAATAEAAAEATTEEAAETAETAEAAASEEAAEETSGSDTLVVGYDTFNQKFSPFFGTTSYDMDVAGVTQVPLLDNDRTGAMIMNGIEGETIPYNGTDYTYYGIADATVTENDDGTVDYDFKLRDDITFSDGEPLTADDVIFSMYVLCDPTYDGSSTLFAQPIEGMEEYRSGMATKYDLMIQAGRDNTDFTYWTEDDQTAFWADIDQAGEKFAQSIADYCIANGYNADTDSISACAANWGYELPEDATAADFWQAIVANYPSEDGSYDDIKTATDTEKADVDFTSLLENYDAYLEGVATGDSVDSIKGITKVNDYEVNVHMTKIDATAIYQLSLSVAPMHYYGEPDKYDYDNNKFGFDKGDLSHVRSVTTEPLGAGPYIFKGYDKGTVHFEANPNYYKGAPKIKYMNWLETQEADKLNGVTTGTVDITTPSITGEVVDAIEQANSNGELTGDKITTTLYDFLGYGYIGIDADLVKIGDGIEARGTEESKDLRKAFATIFSVYRDVAIDSYYGDRASVINYPISNTSWAAPQPTDDGYAVAFSKDVDGNDIYTSDMTADEKYEAAKQAALGYFEAAGFTVEDGKVTKAPEGASLEYEVTIPGGGTGDHPSFMILDLAKDALADIGINLIVNDLSDSSQLWDGLDANQVEMWCAAWGATIDPDMYQIYYSDIANGQKNPGGSNYEYDITDPDLDDLIMQARSTTDQTARKAMYKACLDIIVDWAVEIPVYQRQECMVFSTERVNIDSLPKDTTTFYSWLKEPENITMN